MAAGTGVCWRKAAEAVPHGVEVLLAAGVGEGTLLNEPVGGLGEFEAFGEEHLRGLEEGIEIAAGEPAGGLGVAEALRHMGRDLTEAVDGRGHGAE